MSNKTKKRILTLSLVIALLAIVMIGSSLAWFTDEEEVTNVFTIGSIKIRQDEVDENGDPFEQNQDILPVVNGTDPSSDDNYIHKIVDVTGIGENEAYVRTCIAVPSSLVGYLEIDQTAGDPTSGWHFDFSTYKTVGTENYTVYVFYYDKALSKDETTSDILKGVYLRPEVDLQENPAGALAFCKRDHATGEIDGFSEYDVAGNGNKVNVLVATQAVQADGFANAKAALDSAFGQVVPDFVVTP